MSVRFLHRSYLLFTVAVRSYFTICCALYQFLNHPEIVSLLAEIDKTILKSLELVDVQLHDDISSGFKITMVF